ncbi:DUF2142 domain-containing protein [Mycetocola sp.]|uniref:DUF2142 domain-containing protein n=1 Tax=Mycetocola sp. TaxID=1871042 RepID=UPI003988F484
MKNVWRKTAERPLWTFVASWLGIFILSGSWAVATPMGGSPDEPAHIIKAAAVAHGQLLGEPTSKPAELRVTVPTDVATAATWPCYAFDPTRTAACVVDAVTDASGLSKATTSAGLYNPVYYALVGWPSLLAESPKVAVLGMRLVSALISSFFLAVALTVLLQFRRPFMASATFVAAATPMVFFLNSAVNPNSLEITAGAALLTLLLWVTIGPRPDEHLRMALVLIGVSGALLFNARGISPVWVALIAAAVLIATPGARLAALFRRWEIWACLAVLLAGVGFALAWVLSSGTLNNMGNFPGAGATTPTQAFILMLLDRSFDPGLIGVFGWLDTWSPAFTYVLWSALGAGVGIVALTMIRGRLLVAYIVMALGLFIGPPLIQALSVENSGYIWQGRYTLVAYVCFILLSGVGMMLAPRSHAITATRPVAVTLFWAFGALVAIGQVWALAVTIKRYAVGVNGTWTSLLLNPQWHPPVGVLPWLALALLGQGLILAVLYAALNTGAHRETESVELASAVRS